MPSYFARFLVIFLPPAIVSGPFFADFFITLLALYFLFESIRKKMWRYYLHPFAFLFSFFYIYIVLRSLTSTHPYLSLESSLFYCRFLFSSLAIAYLLDCHKNLINQFGIVLITTLIIVIFDGYIQYFTGTNLLGMDWNKTRLSGFFGEELVLGSFLARIFPLGLFYLATLKNFRGLFHVFVIPLMASVIILIFLTGERTSFFQILLLMIMVIILTKTFRLIGIYSFLIALIGITIFFIFVPHTKGRMVDFTLRQFGLSAESNQLIFFSPPHEAIYQTSLKMFKDKPIFGFGPKLFRLKCSDKKYFVQFVDPLNKNLEITGCSTHSHNTYLQLLAETGVFGTFFVALSFFYVLFNLFKHFYKLYFSSTRSFYLSDANICLYAALFISLWPVMPTGSFFNNWLSVIYFLPVGFLLKIEE